ncbi:MAG: beta-lactamase family protein [Microbacterium sp.]|nr:beta-lactamase family protein [Microbacterium sp.]
MRIRSGLAKAVSALATALAVVLVVSGCSVGGPATVALPALPTAKLPSSTVKDLTSAVTDAMAASGASGAIVGVWAPWSGSWVDGLGTTSPGGKTPVSTDMTFRASTITRPMTCDVLMSLAAQGTVKLDDSVTRYVGGMPKLKDVTLEDLCDGTSGIGSYGAQLRASWLNNPDREWNPEELVSYGLGKMKDDVTPGLAWSDSDAGYVLLGIALERATGKTLSSLVSQYVTSPLGLHATALPGDIPGAPVVGASTALGGYYTPKDAKGALDCKKPTDITDLSASIGSADSGVVSDIDDVGTYVRALASGALVHDKKRFVNGLPVYKGAPSWFTAGGGAIMAGPLVGQYGEIPGYLTAAFSDPVSGLTVAVVLNNSTTGATTALYLAWELAAIASKAAPAKGEKTPASGMPWTPETYHQAIAARAICK